MSDNDVDIRDGRGKRRIKLRDILVGSLLLAIGFSQSVQASTRWVVDMAGRNVEVPESIERPLGAAPPLTALLYALDPDLVQALNIPFTANSGHYLAPGVESLPVVGSAMGHGQQLNPETLLLLQPDVALAWRNSFSDLAPEMMEAPFEKAGIPVLYVQLDRLSDWPQAFEFVGKLVGREARGKALANYIRESLQRVQDALNAIPEAERVSVYYAETPDGLATDCHTSFHTEAIELARGYNPYRCQSQTMVGQERVSMELVSLWDPEFIIVQDPLFLHNAAGDSRWTRLQAFRKGQVLAVPRKPMNWIDRPPSFMRALGIQWLAHAFYPRRFTLDMEEETRRFYRLFFNIELSAEELNELLGPAKNMR